MRDTREAMTEPNPNHAPPLHDDLPLQLPPTDGQTDDGADAETDFGDNEAGDQDDEQVGLDVSVGLDQEADLADLLDDTEREDQRWTEGNDTAQELISLDPRDLEAGDEHGWTADNEAAGDQVAHHADDLSDEDLPALGPDPDGTGMEEEDTGVPGSLRGQGPDDADLPPLDSVAADPDGAGPDDLFDAALLRPMEMAAGDEPECIEVAPSVWATRMPADRLKTVELGGVVATGKVLHVGAQAWLLTDDEILRFDTSRVPPNRFRTTATAWTSEPSGRGVVLSHDRGLSWYGAAGEMTDLGGPSADPAMFGHAIAAYTQDHGRPKLWAQTRLGALFLRMEDPVRWSLVDTPRPGRHLSSDGRRALAYIHAPSDRPCVLMRSLDAGLSWTSRRIELSDESLIRRVLVCRDAVVILSDSMTTPILVFVGDAEPTTPVEGLRGPLGLVYEDGEVALYGGLQIDDRRMLVRQAFSRTPRAPSIVRELGNARVNSISVRNDGTHTELLLVIGDRLERTTIAIEPE